MRRDWLGSGEDMGVFNRIRNRSRIGRGRVKQRVGRARGSQRLQAEGLADLVSGGIRQFGDDVASEFGKVSRGIVRPFGR
jgi:uncharacterized protein YjbJ (UPF0337 family)